MRRLLRRILFVCAVAVLLPSLRAEESKVDGLGDYVLPLNSLSEATDAESTLQQLLAGIVPDRKAPPRVQIKDGHYLLYGNLFRTGDCYALVELPDLVGFTSWEKDKWALRGLWKIPTVWRPAGWQPTEADYLPHTPSSQAFQLLKLGGDKIPVVVVAGEVDKYYQEFYLLRFLPKEKNLQFLTEAMAMPEKVGSYVRLSYDSGRRSIWQEWRYCSWRGSTLADVASWHDETPYNDAEEPFVLVESFDKSDKAQTYRIVDEEDSSESEQTRLITREGQPFASVTFHWREPIASIQTSYNWYEIENAWLFHKLTGLPISAFPRSEEDKPIRPFADFGTVKIIGTKEALKLLH